MSKKNSFSSPHLLSGFPEDTPILVAFSGGADSSVLLRKVCQHAKKADSTVYAAHVNHMIRGEEADRDECFCREVCKSLGVELFVLRRDIPTYAKESGQSIEAAARSVRYEFFDELMLEHDIPILATAHNANDNLETIIFNLTRGAGLDGMCGIPATRSCKHGKVVRPILGMTRAEILDYCAQNSIEYVTDSTNTDTDYTRNKIRALIIPELQRINPSVTDNAARMSASLREDSLCLESLADWFCEEQMNEDASIDVQRLLGAPAAITSRAIMSLYSSMSDGASLEYVHIDAIRELCRRNIPHSRINLPLGVDAVIENNALHLVEHTQVPPPREDFALPLFEGKNTISQINALIVMRNSHNAKNIYKKSIPLYLDFDKINSTLSARARLASDKIRIHGVNKSVKKLLCDLHIPLDVRYRLPMICDGDTVVAIPLVGVADGYKPKEKENSLMLEFILL